jgi:GxxExxY protein
VPSNGFHIPLCQCLPALLSTQRQYPAGSNCGSFSARISDSAITGAVIGAAIEVHKLLGPGLLESAYEQCLSHELTLRRIPFERQRATPTVYKDVKLEHGFRMDFLVDGKVVVELKAVEALIPVHDAIMLTYLRMSGHHIGLLINFNVVVLKHGIRRFVL